MRALPRHPNTTPSGPSSASKAGGCVCGGLAAPKACSRGARRREKGIEGGGDQSHRSLSPSANRPAQLAGPTHPPQTRRPHPHCPPTHRDVPRAVAAPSPALHVSKSTAVDSVTTWVLRLSRDGHNHRVLNLGLYIEPYSMCACTRRARIVSRAYRTRRVRPRARAYVVGRRRTCLRRERTPA